MAPAGLATTALTTTLDCVCIELDSALVPAAEQAGVLAETAWHAVAESTAVEGGPVVLLFRGIEKLSAGASALLSTLAQQRLVPIPSELRRRIPLQHSPRGAWHDGFATLPTNVLLCCLASAPPPPQLAAAFFLLYSVSIEQAEAAPQLRPLSVEAFRALQADGPGCVARVSMPLAAVAALENGLLARRLAASASLLSSGPRPCGGVAPLSQPPPLPPSGSPVAATAAAAAHGDVAPASSGVGGGSGGVSGGGDRSSSASPAPPPSTALEALLAECAVLQGAALGEEERGPPVAQAAATWGGAALVTPAADAAPRVATAARALAALGGRGAATAADVAAVLPWVVP